MTTDLPQGQTQSDQAPEHTKEPWEYWVHKFNAPPFEGTLEHECGIYPPLGESGPVAIASGEANARRIVACVNALSEFSTKEIENGTFRLIGSRAWGGRSIELLRKAKERGLHLDSGGGLVLQNGITALTGKVGPDGYHCVHLGVDGRRAKLNVARVVCFLAHGEPPTKQHVADHIDGNKLNDHPSNLRWSTRSENIRNSRQARAAIAKAEGEGGK